MGGDWTERYIGIPWQEDGIGISGCNCWTLVRLVLLEQAGVEVPTYGEVSAEDMIKVVRQLGRIMGPRSIDGDWLPVEPPTLRTFDVVAMAGRFRQGGGPRRETVHVGIIVPSGSVLHIEEPRDSVHVGLDHPIVRNRITGFYRHKALA